MGERVCHWRHFSVISLFEKNTSDSIINYKDLGMQFRVLSYCFVLHLIRIGFSTSDWVSGMAKTFGLELCAMNQNYARGITFGTVN